MNIIISNSSTDPIYVQILNQIKGMIMEEKLSPGDALPSIRSLAKELGISVITTKRAYEELEKRFGLYTVPTFNRLHSNTSPECAQAIYLKCGGGLAFCW